MEYLVSYKGVTLKLKSEREDLTGLLEAVCTLLYAVETGNDWDDLAVLLKETSKTLREKHINARG